MAPPFAGRRFAEGMTHVLGMPKRLLVGRPMHSERMGETLLPKRIALPVFCSDPLSSNAYATEEIMIMLSVGGLGLAIALGFAEAIGATLHPAPSADGGLTMTLSLPLATT